VQNNVDLKNMSDPRCMDMTITKSKVFKLGSQPSSK
jgi:hypothetical protein